MRDSDGELRRRACLPYLKVMAWLAHYNLMGPIREIGLGCGDDECSDLTKLRPDHLKSLIVHITECVTLDRLRGDLTALFSSIICKDLVLTQIRITRSNSLLIARSMYKTLREIRFIDCSFDHIETLLSYNGEGVCTLISVACMDDVIEEMFKWCLRVNWHCFSCALTRYNNDLPTTYFFYRDDIYEVDITAHLDAYGASP